LQVLQNVEVPSVVMLTTRKRNFVTGLPVLFVKTRCIDSVPSGKERVLFVNGFSHEKALVSRARFGATVAAFVGSGREEFIVAPWPVGLDRFSGPEAPRRETLPS
jgi:hypothetical protein